MRYAGRATVDTDKAKGRPAQRLKKDWGLLEKTHYILTSNHTAVGTIWYGAKFFSPLPSTVP